MFDWDFLDDAWQRSETGIRPMDFDAVVERYGQFLVFETKCHGVPIPQGQEITLRSLVADPRWTVVVVYFSADRKTPHEIAGYEVWKRGPQGTTMIVRHAHGAEHLREWCRAWFAWASRDDEF